MDINDDFTYKEGGCFLNEKGRPKYLQYWLQKMSENIKITQEDQPRWHLLNYQIKLFKNFIYNPSANYQPYLIR